MVVFQKSGHLENDSTNMQALVILTSLVLCVTAAPYDVKVCKEMIGKAGVSERFNETVAHAIHSLTVQGLKMFNPRATVNNGVPTVNHNLKSKDTVLPYAPEDPLGNDFATQPMNAIDKILSTLGQADDGLGPNWSPIERVAHNFHMNDLWSRVLHVFPDVQINPPSQSACDCLINTSANGIRAAVQWVADHYATGTPITLLNRPIPKLTDAASWAVWKDRLLHYYDVSSLVDAATYIYCVTKDM